MNNNVGLHHMDRKTIAIVVVILLIIGAVAAKQTYGAKMGRVPVRRRTARVPMPKKPVSESYLRREHDVSRAKSLHQNYDFA